MRRTTLGLADDDQAREAFCRAGEGLAGGDELDRRFASDVRLRDESGAAGDGAGDAFGDGVPADEVVAGLEPVGEIDSARVAAEADGEDGIRPGGRGGDGEAGRAGVRGE